MPMMRLEKLTNNLPPLLTPNTLYFIKSEKGVTMHITDKDGVLAYKISQEEEIEPFFFMGVNPDA